MDLAAGLFAEDSHAIISMREDLAESRAREARAQQREAIAQEQLVMNTAEVQRLQTELGKLQGAVQDAQDTRRRSETKRAALQNELDVMREANTSVTASEAEALQVAQGVSWESRFQQGVLEARIEAAELQAEMAWRRKLMGAEEQKEAAQAEAQRWRATLDKQDLKLASLRLKHKVDRGTWAAHVLTRDTTMQVKDTWAAWKHAVFGKSHQDMWDMHVFYLQKQVEEHGRQRTKLLQRYGGILDGIMKRHMKQHATTFLVECWHSWRVVIKKQVEAKTISRTKQARAGIIHGGMDLLERNKNRESRAHVFRTWHALNRLDVLERTAGHAVMAHGDSHNRLVDNLGEAFARAMGHRAVAETLRAWRTKVQAVVLRRNLVDHFRGYPAKPPDENGRAAAARRRAGGWQDNFRPPSPTKSKSAASPSPVSAAGRLGMVRESPSPSGGLSAQARRRRAQQDYDDYAGLGLAAQREDADEGSAATGPRGAREGEESRFAWPRQAAYEDREGGPGGRRRGSRQGDEGYAGSWRDDESYDGARRPPLDPLLRGGAWPDREGAPGDDGRGMAPFLDEDDNFRAAIQGRGQGYPGARRASVTEFVGRLRAESDLGVYGEGEEEEGFEGYPSARRPPDSSRLGGDDEGYPSSYPSARLAAVEPTLPVGRRGGAQEDEAYSYASSRLGSRQEQLESYSYAPASRRVSRQDQPDLGPSPAASRRGSRQEQLAEASGSGLVPRQEQPGPSPLSAGRLGFQLEPSPDSPTSRYTAAYSDTPGALDRRRVRAVATGRNQMAGWCCSPWQDSNVGVRQVLLAWRMQVLGNWVVEAKGRGLDLLRTRGSDQANLLCKAFLGWRHLVDHWTFKARTQARTASAERLTAKRNTQMGRIGEVMSRPQDNLTTAMVLAAWKKKVTGSHIERQTTERVQDFRTTVYQFHRRAVTVLLLQLAVHKDVLGLQACLNAWRGLTPAASVGAGYVRAEMRQLEERHQFVTDSGALLWADSDDNLDLSLLLSCWALVVRRAKDYRIRLRREIFVGRLVLRFKAENVSFLAAVAFRIWDQEARGKGRADYTLKDHKRVHTARFALKVAWDRWERKTLKMCWYAWRQHKHHETSSRRTVTKLSSLEVGLLEKYDQVTQQAVQRLSESGAWLLRRMLLRAWYDQARQERFIRYTARVKGSHNSSVGWIMSKVMGADRAALLVSTMQYWARLAAKTANSRQMQGMMHTLMTGPETGLLLKSTFVAWHRVRIDRRMLDYRYDLRELGETHVRLQKRSYTLHIGSLLLHDGLSNRARLQLSMRCWGELVANGRDGQRVQEKEQAVDASERKRETVVKAITRVWKDQARHIMLRDFMVLWKISWAMFRMEKITDSREEVTHIVADGNRKEHTELTAVLALLAWQRHCVDTRMVRRRIALVKRSSDSQLCLVVKMAFAAFMLGTKLFKLEERTERSLKHGMRARVCVRRNFNRVHAEVDEDRLTNFLEAWRVVVKTRRGEREYRDLHQKVEDMRRRCKAGGKQLLMAIGRSEAAKGLEHVLRRWQETAQRPRQQLRRLFRAWTAGAMNSRRERDLEEVGEKHITQVRQRRCDVYRLVSQLTGHRVAQTAELIVVQWRAQALQGRQRAMLLRQNRRERTGLIGGMVDKSQDLELALGLREILTTWREAVEMGRRRRVLASCLGSRDRFVNRLGDERVGQEGLGLAAEALRAWRLYVDRLIRQLHDRYRVRHDRDVSRLVDAGCDNTLLYNIAVLFDLWRHVTVMGRTSSLLEKAVHRVGEAGAEGEAEVRRLNAKRRAQLDCAALAWSRQTEVESLLAVVRAWRAAGLGGALRRRAKEVHWQLHGGRHSGGMEGRHSSLCAQWALTTWRVAIKDSVQNRRQGAAKALAAEKRETGLGRLSSFFRHQRSLLLLAEKILSEWRRAGALQRLGRAYSALTFGGATWGLNEQLSVYSLRLCFALWRNLPSLHRVDNANALASEVTRLARLHRQTCRELGTQVAQLNDLIPINLVMQYWRLKVLWSRMEAHLRRRDRRTGTLVDNAVGHWLRSDTRELAYSVLMLWKQLAMATGFTAVLRVREEATAGEVPRKRKDRLLFKLEDKYDGDRTETALKCILDAWHLEASRWGRTRKTWEVEAWTAKIKRQRVQGADRVFQGVEAGFKASGLALLLTAWRSVAGRRAGSRSAAGRALQRGAAADSQRDVVVAWANLVRLRRTRRTFTEHSLEGSSAVRRVMLTAVWNAWLTEAYHEKGRPAPPRPESSMASASGSLRSILSAQSGQLRDLQRRTFLRSCLQSHEGSNEVILVHCMRWWHQFAAVEGLERHFADQAGISASARVRRRRMLDNVDYLLGAHRDERELAQVFSAWAQQSGVLVRRARSLAYQVQPSSEMRQMRSTAERAEQMQQQLQLIDDIQNEVLGVEVNSAILCKVFFSWVHALDIKKLTELEEELAIANVKVANLQRERERSYEELSAMQPSRSLVGPDEDELQSELAEERRASRELKAQLEHSVSQLLQLRTRSASSA